MGRALAGEQRGWTEEVARRFGSTLRRLREDRGLSQESLAHEAGLTKNQIQLLEAGRASGRKDSTGGSNPSMKTLSGLSGALDMKVSELLAEAEL